MEFTKHLASLFLLQDVAQDQIYMDEIFLEMPGPSRTTWRWNVGINYFGISGDKRWWQDHRIPGGLGFSTNSVGHPVKSGQIAEKMTELQDLLGEGSEEFVSTKVSSLPTALEWAMRTIHIASSGPSGKATELVPLEKDSTSPACPINLPRFLEDRNHCTYRGWYHTDITIPTEYFVADVERPAKLTSHELDFTYLFNQELTNPDYVTTATGRRVRDFDKGLPGPEKASRANGTIEPTAAQPRLVNALTLSMPTEL